jgi:shikimate kinase
VENEENMLLLSQNSIIIWLNLPFEWLIPRIDETRPLSHTIDKLKALAQNRERLYREFADIIIDNPHNILQETGEKLNEYLNHQWPES